MLGACSSEDEPARVIPTDPVVSVPAQADVVTLNAPAQTEVLTYVDNTSIYRFNYANGMVLTCDVQKSVSNGTTSYNALVKRIEYTGSDVQLPPYLKMKINGEESDVRVYSLFLYTDGIPDNVTSITLPNTAIATWKQGKFEAATAADIRAQLERGANLEKIEFENGFRGFCSIDGAVYTSDFTTLVGVPRGKSGVFTVADGTATIDNRAFYYCQNITGVTLPESVTEIKAEAFDFTDKLALINSLNPEAPSASDDAFGMYARMATVRIPAGSLSMYTPERPDIEEPVLPDAPPADASAEEYAQYTQAMQQYRDDMKLYEAAMSAYTRVLGWSNMKMEEVSF